MRVTCGTDIIEIDRIKESIEKLGSKFINRIFTKNEIEYCESKSEQKYQHYAARFAAKEAAFKALSWKIDNKYDVSWTDFEVSVNNQGRPALNITAMNLEGIENIDISISHCKDYAIANVTVLGRSNMNYFDNHCHLDDEKFDEDRDRIIEEIHQDEIQKMVSAGYSLEGSKRSIELSKKYDFIYSTCGISPNDIPHTEEELWKNLREIKNLAKNNKKIVAIGEIGLDYHWNKENKELQKRAFIEQIKIANELKLPIQIHTREAVYDTIEILKQNLVEKRGIFHCCPLNRELVKEGLSLGFYISFAGPITFKNSKNADEIIKMVPNDRMLVETDSPYLSPEPFRGKRNDPRNVKLIAKKIAEVKELSLEEVANITYKNAINIFEIK